MCLKEQVRTGTDASLSCFNLLQEMQHYSVLAETVYAAAASIDRWRSGLHGVLTALGHQNKQWQWWQIQSLQSHTICESRPLKLPSVTIDSKVSQCFYYALIPFLTPLFNVFYLYFPSLAVPNPTPPHSTPPHLLLRSIALSLIGHWLGFFYYAGPPVP